MTDRERRYTEEEVRAILDLALKRDARALRHTELLATAAEVGISPESVEAAARELDEGREEREVRELIVARRRRGLHSHLSVYLIVNAALIALNFLTWMVGARVPWSLFPILGWGIGMAIHALNARSTDVDMSEVTHELARREKERKKRERLRTKGGLLQGAENLGAAVGESVGHLLSNIAHEIRTTSPAASPTGAGPRVAAPDASRARVDVSEALEDLSDAAGTDEAGRAGR